MGLPWIRLDTSMPDNPKLLGLLTEKDGHRAAFVWVCAMSYAGKHGTDGFLTRESVARINGRSTDMALLVTHGFLEVLAGGWQLHGWDEFQISDEDSQNRRSRAQKAAAVRWSKHETAATGKGKGNVRAMH
jgi:hypothetical protein